VIKKVTGRNGLLYEPIAYGKELKTGTAQKDQLL
jgi:hypothetical protein